MVKRRQMTLAKIGKSFDALDVSEGKDQLELKKKTAVKSAIVDKIKKTFI